ncbi:MAG: hypothetical protein PHS14_16950 [Elusimicrobia bacterium]|nr:hypothetical protein [Elusimicrobiota bacterium]
MAGELVLPDQDPAVLDYRARAEAFNREAVALTVDSDATQILATALLTRAAGVTKAAEAKRIEIVKVHNDFVKRVNEFFRHVLKPVVEGDTALRGKVLAYVREKNRKAAEAEAAAERQRLESEALLKEAEKAEAAGQAGVADGLLMGAVSREMEAAVSRV